MRYSKGLPADEGATGAAVLGAPVLLYALARLEGVLVCRIRAVADPPAHAPLINRAGQRSSAAQRSAVQCSTHQSWTACCIEVPLIWNLFH